MSEPDPTQEPECLKPIEQDQLLQSNTEDNNSKKGNALMETAELLTTVGNLTHDAYISTVREAQSFVNFLHNQLKSSQEDKNKR